MSLEEHEIFFLCVYACVHYFFLEKLYSCHFAVFSSYQKWALKESNPGWKFELFRFENTLKVLLHQSLLSNVAVELVM